MSAFGPLSPLDATLDQKLVDGSALDTGKPAGDPVACAHVALVEGTGPCLTEEIHTLLYTRMRAATLVLFAASSAFLLKQLIYDPLAGSVDPRLRRFDPFLVGMHIAQVVALGGVLAVMWRRRVCICLKKLRWLELLVFGSTTLLLAVTDHVATIFTAEKYAYIDEPVEVWSAVAFIYGMFIPNTVRRAAVVVGVMCAMPLAIMVVDAVREDAVRQNFTLDHFSGTAITMLATFGATVFGTYTIGSLRRAAFEAQQLGQYRLRHRIGAGGMGEVFLAEHQLLKRRCAIKLIRPGKAADPLALARFEREVQTTATLSHWNTIEIFDYGRTDDGTFYYVMEYLPGLSLAELVHRFGPLPPERAVHLLEQTCDALAEAHSIGLIHRDVKPGNIFAAQRGGIHDVAKLLDFGLVKSASDQTALDLTRDGAVTGSPLFMSPEQVLGETEPDVRSDIYSLGAVAFFLLTGRPPFVGDAPMRVMMAHVQQTPPRPTTLRPDVPADLEEVVLRCLAKDPAQRFADAASLREAFRACSHYGIWTRESAARWWRDVLPLAEPVSVVT